MRVGDVVRFDRRGDWLVAVWPDEIDMTNAVGAERLTLASTRNSDVGVIVDLTETRYIDSAGIRALFVIRKQLDERQQQLRLIVPEESLARRTLDVSGVMSVMNVLTSMTDSLEA